MAQYQNIEIDEGIAKRVAGVAADVRRVKQMVPVLYDQEWAKTADLELATYYMHRNVEKKDGLRYDITIIPSFVLGLEPNKTLGHYHLGAGELYIVLQGTATLLVQEREEGKNDSVENCYYVIAQKGQALAIPNFAAHFTINATKEPLVMANWVKSDCKNDYAPIEKMAGACYYYTTDGWLENRAYSHISQLRQIQPLEKIPQNLDFLR